MDHFKTLMGKGKEEGRTELKWKQNERKERKQGRTERKRKKHRPSIPLLPILPFCIKGN